MPSDDPLIKALEALALPGDYQTMYDRPIRHEFDNTIAPLVSALRLTIAEVQNLRDEIAELRGD